MIDQHFLLFSRIKKRQVFDVWNVKNKKICSQNPPETWKQLKY